jgi:hypothetical protein
VHNFVEICDLQIIHENLRICDLRTGTPEKFVDVLKKLHISDLRT